MIRWLMSYPGGLKLTRSSLHSLVICSYGSLNIGRPAFFESSCLTYRHRILHRLLILRWCEYAGSHLLRPCQYSHYAYLQLLHRSARIFNWQLSIIVSLFHLFRGKKRNVLRNRIDNCDYDLDQLLLGTILFTLLFFLLPTVVVFYLTFASARMAIISLKASLDTVSGMSQSLSTVRSHVTHQGQQAITRWHTL